MRQGWIAVVAMLALAGVAQDAAAQALTEQQLLGRRLFTQSCLVCHTRPQITAGTYGPPLSRESAGGQADTMRAFISEGTPRMPGFKYHFAPAEIDAIVQFLKTVPKPAAPGGKGVAGDSPVD